MENGERKIDSADPTTPLALFLRVPTSLVVKLRVMFTTFVFGDMYCHTGMPCRRHKAWYPSRHSIETQGRPVVVLSIDVERHTVIHNYPFNVLGET